MWYIHTAIVAIYITAEILFRSPAQDTSIAEGFVSLCFFGGLLYSGRYLWHAMKREQSNPIRGERMRHLLIIFALVVLALGTEGLLRAFIGYDSSLPLDFRMRSRFLQGIAPPVGAAISVLFLRKGHAKTV